MSYKLMITTAVYNDDGTVVNLSRRGEKPFLARTQVVLQEFVHVENAHAELNKVHALVRNLRAIMSDNAAVDKFPSVNRSEGEGG